MSELRDLSAAVHLGSAKRIVVKIGSALLCANNGSVRKRWLASLANDIAVFRKKGCDVIAVSSGAVALGRIRLKLGHKLRLEEKQAASAAGQTILVEAWQEAFKPHAVNVAQLLLTLDDTENRRRYLNARATFQTLLELGALPLVNENDTVATSEIRYGDNDRLAAHTAQLSQSDVVVILSDIDGLYTSDPRDSLHARFIPVVNTITSEIERAAGGVNKGAGVGSGGMASKIAAAKLAGANGCATIIARGVVCNPLKNILCGGRATLVRPSQTSENARRQWIGGRLKPAGVVQIDAGAVVALKAGASLLPAGVKGVVGEFARGDIIALVDEVGGVIAQGLSSYDANEVRSLAGQQSSEIERLLGYRRRPAVVEKDDLVLRVG